MKNYKKTISVLLVLIGLVMILFYFFKRSEAIPLEEVQAPVTQQKEAETVVKKEKQDTLVLSTTTPNGVVLKITAELCSIKEYNEASCFGSGRIGPFTYENVSLYDLISTEEETGFGLVVETGLETLLYKVLVSNASGGALLVEDYAFYKDFLITYFKNH